MIGAEEARRGSSRRGGGEGGRRGGVGDKNNLKEACVLCVRECDKKFVFFWSVGSSIFAGGEISRATRGGLFDLRSLLDQKRVKQGAKFACLEQQERPHA